MRLKHSTCTISGDQDRHKTDYVTGVAAVPYHIALPPSWCSTALGSPPKPIVPPTIGEESRGWAPSSPSIVTHFLGVPTLVLPHGDHRELARLEHWESGCDENYQCFNLSKLRSCVQHPRSTPRQWLC